MPEISRFFGIVIYMNWREHPPMHFHAVYGEHEALMTWTARCTPVRYRAGRCRWFANGWRCIGTKLKQTGILHMQKKPLNPIDPLE
jgi:hypothetical protein